ncbi:hypothetical protein WKR88_19760 [Trinickia caryophylli]|uniref:Uncharacterized protein n=1 Tax=Trinickia caryophylli TaxID=28094 RepID=A0A1X7DC68_TRICW|nr:hypothetical protein [Trinickia caryophylli]PMS09745.1 hypothetical protein C0Z17_22970 [Trinickia caryophylli]TRX16805.1 hypothetical protein FNF07_00225 [Trinickia caryophylli]WQE12469.1 hypothetical protein U0034_03320 [Trinickia caryophylli]SMF12691.1 hypothetical protein SAMN06295900_1039 [Trinickia caryophylli]GLU31381.1 hypothetical protein Busp01_12230 [Trinickia caryophylli]
MIEPFSFLAYQPDGQGLICAVTLIVEGDNVYGWYTGPAGGNFTAAYFVLDRYYSTHETAFYHSVENDVRSDWVLAYPPLEIDAGRHSPVPEDVSHELERVQGAFAAEWLFYCDDTAAAADVEWYRMRSLPVTYAGIRCEKLSKLDPVGVFWTYGSPGLDMNIIDFLRKRWPLDYALAP